ncbi:MULTISPECIES: S-layer homology domain-containing protein [Solibacillus]|uniref:S-layer homology domain-containing protein n=1 Tax=Solibacillus merdavium TaxID=2762218 RepID=A0ABR8XHK8_9BACL|nr:S-layer homology domain-containing protein [Solibacillus merdavium]MBD8031427.1 S-layer homology domain-containing protein [Solibacillus merdavium]
MANQPKKYTKFVAAAATATLVASAIVPVASAASFKDVADTNSHAVNIEALVEAGIIKGFEDGTFKPGQELTRGHVVKMLGKWVENQGIEIPADFATKARFTDVAVDAKDQELVKYAALVADTGVFNGSNGALNASGKITRENMALVLDRAFKAINDTTLVELATKIEDVKVADLATAKAEAREAIQALRDLGISVVENFNPKNTVTRGQFASFLNKTINTSVELTVKEVVAVDTKTLNVTLSDDSTHVVTLEKALEANEATEVTFTIDGKEYTATVTFKVEAPKVMSVNIVDGVTVEVKFSEAVLKTDINNKVSIQGTTLDTASLSEDGKTLTLNSDSAINVKDAAVVVEPIRTAKDRLVKTAKFVSVVTYKDEVAPSIVSVKAVTKGKATETVVVTLSEKATIGSAKINGTNVAADKIKVEGKTVTLEGVTVEAGKAHTVELFNVVDTAGNKSVKASKAFEVTVDTVAPTATIEAAGDNAILVTFDKAMNVDSVKAALVNGIVKDELLGAVTSDTATVVEKSDNKQFLVELKDNAVFANKDSRTFTVVLGGTMTDALGNKFAATTKSVTLTKDAVKPVATGYDIIVDENGKVEEIVVEFNEALAAKSAINFGTIATVVNAEGKVDSTLDTLTGSVEKGSKKVSFKFAAPVLVEGKLAVTFNKDLVTDLALAANKSEAFNMTFDFGTAKTSTEFKMAAGAFDTTSADTIKVTFPEAVKGGAVAGSATDLANYTLDGKALTGATITISADNKVATIKLAEGTITADNNTAVMKVSNVQNLAGTKTVKAYEETIAVQDTKAPELTSAVIIDNQTIELTYNEAVQFGGTFASDFSLIVDGEASTVALSNAAVVAGKDNTLRVTLSAPVNFSLVDTVAVKVIGNASVTDKGARANAQKLNIEVKAK